jgi:hypothetical protein
MVGWRKSCLNLDSIGVTGIDIIIGITFSSGCGAFDLRSKYNTKGDFVNGYPG